MKSVSAAARRRRSFRCIPSIFWRYILPNIAMAAPRVQTAEAFGPPVLDRHVAALLAMTTRECHKPAKEVLTDESAADVGL
jgi:hypothetical protein